jgi:hypothetical protein
MVGMSYVGATLLIAGMSAKDAFHTFLVLMDKHMKVTDGGNTRFRFASRKRKRLFFSKKKKKKKKKKMTRATRA